MAVDSLFKEIERQERLSDRVQARIQELVLTEELRAGERLPSERELANLLGVSRTVVREAIRSLIGKGMLEVRAGSGMYVRHLPKEAVSEPMNLYLRTRLRDRRDIYEVRRVLEVEIAGLAAERADPGDVRALEESVRRISLEGMDPMEFADEDVGFHALLAEATHNELFPILLDSISGILREVRIIGFRLPETQRMAVHFHTRIVERLRARDVEGAREAMLAHVDESIETFAAAARTLEGVDP